MMKELLSQLITFNDVKLYVERLDGKNNVDKCY